MVYPTMLQQFPKHTLELPLEFMANVGTLVGGAIALDRTAFSVTSLQEQEAEEKQY